MRTFIFVLAALASLWAPSPAFAQSRSETVAQLEAQFQAALIRERRLADERESGLIRDYEQRLRTTAAELRAARARGAGATAEARALQASLDRLRTDYADLVAAIAARDIGAAQRFATFRETVLAMTARAGPEEVSALQRFADGDRVGAWPTIEQLARRAGDAPALRSALALRMIMLRFGEAQSSDVLALADSVIAADPDDFQTRLLRANLLGQTQGLAAVSEAAAGLVGAARTNLERYFALFLQAQTRLAEGRTAEGEALIEDALVALRAAGDEAAPADRIGAEVQALLQLATIRAGQADAQGQQQRLSEATALLREWVETDPRAIGPKDMLAWILQTQGQVRMQREDVEGAEAFFAEANTIKEQLLARDRDNHARIFELSMSYHALCEWRRGRHGFIMTSIEDAPAYVRRNLEGAAEACDRAITLARMLPTSPMIDWQLAAQLNAAGGANAMLGRNDAAIERHREALAIWRRLAENDPTFIPVLRQRAYATGMLASVPGSQQSWREVVAAWDALGAQAPLQDAEREMRNQAELFATMMGEP